MLSVSSVSFSVWEPHSILESSVIAVEKESDLSSPLLGVVFGGKCPTCFETKHKCPGHWGSIRLAEPMYHISWIPHLLRLLKKVKGKFMWDKQSASIRKDGEIFPAYACFEVLGEKLDNPPLISVLPVPPPHVRPALFVDGVLRGENDLTYRLQNIVRKNNKLLDLKRCERPPEVIQQGREALQNAITGFINHEKLGSSRHTRNKREYASCSTRIQKKGGRIRHNLMGKRVEFTARCVITADDGLKLTEIGVPEKVANTLTVPVKVTDYNKANLQELVDAGKFKYVTSGGSRSSKAVDLEVGATVERFLRNGDVVLFNRQPSLHKQSLMGHYVRILPGNTFRMNVACTSPYNADFDGDEMNIHVPQTVQARAEAEEIMLVKHNIISAQANCPVIGLIQDALLGTYLLSGDVFTRANAMQIAQCPTGVTGKEIISTILPDITYERGGVKIVRGTFLEGRLTKRDVGKSNGSLVHIIYNDFGADACVDFIYNLQGLAHRYLQIRGFTIGIGDLVRSKEAAKACEQEKENAFRDAQNLEDPNARLNACRAVMGRTVMEDMDDTNSFYCMVNSGSKGSMVNITQVQACLGQMNVQGGRIPCQWVDRTATEFKRGEHTPTAKGFVSSSYLEGLTPFEMFAHSMSGREGLIDTAIKTAQTGYTERKLMKCLENVISCADGTVRDGQRVIQFVYGDDGFDGARIETQKVSPLKGARKEDVAVLKESFHSPIPVHRLVKRMRLYGGVGHACGAPLPEWLVPNQLLRAFLNVHTPKMIPSVRKRYEQDIKSYLERARICGGEGVGALAAQSIGERTTQCTLNSVDYNEWLLVWGYPKTCCIGQMIDEIMSGGYFLNNGAQIANVKGLWSLTVDELGNVSWKKITHVTRHPPPDGNKLIKITTASGRQLVATKAKSFLVVRDTIEEIAGSDIRVGDKVPLLKLKLKGEYGFPAIGGILGAFYAAGTLKGNVAEFPLRLRKYFQSVSVCTHSISCTFTDKVRVYSERLCNMFRGVGAFPMLLLKTSTIACITFCRAFIEGRQEVDEGYVFVRCETPMKEGLAMLLNTFDIACRVSGVGIMLDPDNVVELYKDKKIQDGYNAEEIVHIEEVESSHEYVYDLTVEETKNMCAFNGIACRDTFHFAGMSSKNVTLGIPRLKEILSVTKNPKTPVTTIRDRGALQLKYDVLADHILPNQDDSVESFWIFPDKGIHKGEARARWGEPTRLTLTPDVSLVSMFEFCAYKMYPDRLVCDVYGEIPEKRGVKGAEWCKWLGEHVETTLQDFSKLAEVCEKMETAYTNDIYRMFKMFGVECARNCLLIELRKILDHYGIYINARHLFVLVDAMTHYGDVTPLTRHGLKRTEASALKRCTFEEVVTVLNEAALKNVTDPVEGISACILTGKVAALGSNTVTVLKDHVMEKKYKVDPPVEEGVDMWMPMPFMDLPPKEAAPAPQSPTYAPNSPTYDPW